MQQTRFFNNCKYFMELHLYKLDKGLMGNATYHNLKQLSQMVLKKKIFLIFLCISMVRTYDPQAQGRLGLCDLHLNKLGK